MCALLPTPRNEESTIFPRYKIISYIYIHFHFSLTHTHKKKKLFRPPFTVQNWNIHPSLRQQLKKWVILPPFPLSTKINMVRKESGGGNLCRADREKRSVRRETRRRRRMRWRRMWVWRGRWDGGIPSVVRLRNLFQCFKCSKCLCLTTVSLQNVYRLFSVLSNYSVWLVGLFLHSFPPLRFCSLMPLPSLSHPAVAAAAKCFFFFFSSQLIPLTPVFFFPLPPSSSCYMSRLRPLLFLLPLNTCWPLYLARHHQYQAGVVGTTGDN